MAKRIIRKPKDTPPDLVTYIKRKWDDQETHAQARYEDWYNNIAFYLGYQWQSWSNSTMSYWAPPHETVSGLLMVVGDLLQPLVDTRISKYVGNRPQIIVTAQSEDPMAVEQADKETRILNAIWKQLNMRSRLVDIAKWMVITNQCFARVRWDKSFGDEIKNPQYISPTTTPDQKPSFRLGTLSLDLINGYQLRFDTTKKTWKDVRDYGWVAIKSVQTKNNLINSIPEKRDVIEKLEAENVSAINEMSAKVLRLQDKESDELPKHDTDRYDMEQSLIVYEYYHAPTYKDKNGLHAIVCQNELLYEGVLPNKLKRIPIVMFQDRRGIDTLWGRSLLSHSRQLQKIYNLLLSKIVSYAMLPVIYGYPRGSGLDLESLPDSGYVITEYDNEEGAPMISAPAPMPDSWMFLMNYIQNILEHKWGTHEVSMRGTTPGNTRLSGRGIYLLQEGDQARLGPWYMTWEDSLEDLGELMLTITQDKAEETRSGTYVSDEGYSYPIQWNKNDISGNGKVQVEVGSEFMRNKQAMQKLFTDIMNSLPNLPALAQTFNDPVGLHNLFSMLDEGLANRLVFRNKDAQTAERENRKLMAGIEVAKVEEWHNHPLHLLQHFRLMNTPEYERLPQKLRDAWYGYHIKAHEFEFMKKQQQMQGGAGAPPEPPGGGGLFQQGGDMPVEPEMTAIDQTVEGKVNPEGGAGVTAGMEETP